jgi:16S rRNA (cytosine967-C5)-methyltransferase
MANTVTELQAKHIVDVVSKVIENGFPVDKTIHFQFKNNRITDEYDRSVIASVSYELVRWWRLLCEIDNNFPVVHDVNYYKVLASWLILNKWDVPAIVPMRGINAQNVLQQYESLSAFRKIKFSMPDWLDQKGFLAYSTEWETELEAINKQAPIYIRTNRLKTKPADLSALLKKEGFDNEAVEKAPDALKITGKVNIFDSKYYKDGYFEIQDAGSQLISMFLDVKPGMRVVDTCAGNGGKTLHLASLMQNKGKIVAMDTQEDKISTLKSRVAKAGADIVEARLIEGTKSTKRLSQSFDRVLIDSPCSGSGTIRRNPEIKWHMNPQRLDKIKNIQNIVLKNYADMVKPEGLIVYATCSILPEENHERVEAFLEAQKGNYELVKEQQITTSQNGFDGFYMAQIRRLK